MSDAEFNLLLENATRRKLTAVEEARLRARLASDPSAKAVWEEEMALSQLLHRLPDAPLATNFAAQVLATVEREERRHWPAPRILRRLGLRRPAQQFAAAAPTNAPGNTRRPPLPPPPIAYFRQLLGLRQVDLDKTLAGIAEPIRTNLQAKLREYAALTADERETRLQATELQWYLGPLM